MATKSEEEKSESIPKPWMKKMSKRKAHLPYYFNTEMHETSLTLPSIAVERDPKTAGVPVTVEAAPVIQKKKRKKTESLSKKRKKVQDKGSSCKETCLSGEKSLKMCENRTPSVGKQSNSWIRKESKAKELGEEIAVVFERQPIVRKEDSADKEKLVLHPQSSHSSSDDGRSSHISDILKKVESTKRKDHVSEGGSEDKHKPVNLHEPDRKPISFSVSAKTKNKFLNDLKSTSSKTADSTNSKPDVHPSILAFQKLSKTVKWSKPRTLLSKDSSHSQEMYKKENEVVVEPVKKKIENQLSKTKDRLLKLKSLKKKATKVKTSELILKGLVPFEYGSSDEENSEQKGKDKEKNVTPMSRFDKIFVKSSDSSDSISTSDLPKKKAPYQRQTKPLFEGITHNDYDQVVDKITKSKRENEDEARVTYDEILNTLQEKKTCTEEIGAVKYVVQVEDMEVEDQEIMKEIASFRVKVDVSHHSNKKQLYADFDGDTNYAYYVIDTNILLRDLKFLEDLKMRKIDEKPVIIVIPYIVLEELDGLKKSKSVGKASQDAICWCNRYFENKDKRVVGQKYGDYLNTLTQNPRSNADDLIRDCCQLMKQQNLSVTLLTNDVNLRNKSLLSSIAAISVRKLKSYLNIERKDNYSSIDSDEGIHFIEKSDGSCQDFGRPPDTISVTIPDTCCPPVENSGLDTCVEMKIEHLPKKKLLLNLSTKDVSGHEKTSWSNIESSLKKTLGNILEAAFKESYGDDLWKQIIVHKPPWTLREIFTCWDKHWLAVFIDKFPNHVRDLLTKLNILMTAAPSDSQTVYKKVETLYEIFEKTTYSTYIVAIHPEILEVISDSAMKESNQDSTESETSKDTNSEDSRQDGLTNLKEMINLVGMYITHFLAMIFDGCGISHELPRINDNQITREDAHSSAVNLHSVIMRLGACIVNCVTSTSASNLQEFGMLLVNFWDDAKQPCPNLPFTLEDLMLVVTTPDGRSFLEMVARELERLLFMLTALLKS